MLERLSDALEELSRVDCAELSSLLKQFSAVIVNETSENLDKEALLKQILILAEQTALPKLQRKKLLTTSALFYIALFSSVRSIGSFLIENRDRINSLVEFASPASTTKK